MKEQITNMVEKAKQGPTWLRAGVAAIPWAGGALDHLLFDKAGEIRMKNVEQALNDMKESFEKIKEEKVSKEWFESEEALDMLKNLLQKIEFEGDAAKVKALSKVYCLFGTKKHKDDPNKYAVLETISKMTSNQRVIFKAVGCVPEVSKTNSSGAISYTGSAIWLSDILGYIKQNNTVLSQLKSPTGNVTLDVELDILISFNLLRGISMPNMPEKGYSITQLGKLALSYLAEVA